MISGFLLSISSVYLNHVVFADDSWSDIAQRQQAAEQKALAVYQIKYQFANTNETTRDWSGLTSISTDETSRGRNIDQQAQVSLENGLAQFDQEHILQLAYIQSNYTGLTNTPTDTEGRDRNVMIAEAQATSQAQSEAILNELHKIQASYANFEAGPTTEGYGYDRKAAVEEKWNTAESQAADLVSSLAKINGVYVDLSQYTEGTKFVYQEGSTTNMKTIGRQIGPAQEYAIQKAILIFEDIHQKHLEELQSNYYGLTNTPTDTEGRDRTAMLAQNTQTSLDNALRVYNAYYGGAGLR